MSFKETDFPGLIKYLKRIVEEEKDPMLVKELVAQLVKLYDEVPLYPGIVNMCIGGVAKTVKPDEVQVGQKIFIRNREDCFSGTVAEKDGDGIVLKAVRSVSVEDELDLGFREMEKVVVVNNDVLKEMWPSLVFGREHK
jgi:ribosomal protein L19